MANEVDTLMEHLTHSCEDTMNKDPLLCSPKDIDIVVAYHRKNRASQAEGGKRSRPSRDSGPKVDISPFLTDMIAQSTAPKQSIRRR